MSYDFMRVLLFFDLPVITKKQKRKYIEFRKFLIRKGYLMLQYSVYSKLLNNRDSAIQHIEVIRRAVPIEGHVRIIMLTEKQYARMEIIVGGKSKREKLTIIDPFLIL